MKTIERKITVKIKPDPFEIAEIFCDYDSTMQAEFFNAIAYIVDHQWDKPLAMQLQNLTDDKALETEGRQVMEQIGEYSAIS